MSSNNNSPVGEYKTILQDSGELAYVNRLMIGTAATGLVRIEWHNARGGAIIPTNWSNFEMQFEVPSYYPMRYQVDDAQNMIVRECLDKQFEWLILLEHDVVIPYWMFLEFNRYIREASAPVVSGLYFLRSWPSEPLVYRIPGTGPFYDWKIGERVWVDGVPTGCLLIHSSILRVMWEESEEYRLGDQVTRRVFETPRKVFVDPITHQLNNMRGTSDLNWCKRVIDNDYIRKAGWNDYADSLEDERFPFIVDTALFCVHIDMGGVKYPANWQELSLAAEYEISQRSTKPTVEAPPDLGISVTDGVKAKAIFGQR